MYIHTGVGNLGTYSYASTSRVAAEVLGYDWENVEIVRGDSSRNLPWTPNQGGSNTSFTESRANYASATDAVQKLKELAARDLGGSPGDYDIANEAVCARANPSRRLTYAAAAQRAIQLGGRFSGQEVPDDINEMTARAVEGIAGTGLIGVARDNLPRNGTVPALATGFIEIELDVETGQFEIIDYLGVADCGTVLHPPGSVGADQGWGRDGLRDGGPRAPYLRHSLRFAGDRRISPDQAPNLSGRSCRNGVGRRQQGPIPRTRWGRRELASRLWDVRQPRSCARSPTPWAATTSIDHRSCRT